MIPSIRVLIVDDSTLVRQALTIGLARDPALEIVGGAPDPYAARDLILQLRPDVLTLDVEMPRMDGVTFLRKLMPQYPIPVVMVSALTERGQQTTLDALAAGAVDFVTKPRGGAPDGLSDMLLELRTKIKIAAAANLSRWRQPTSGHAASTARPPTRRSPHATNHQVIAIGASTGGTEALCTLLAALPTDCPGVVVVQHMPAGFTHMFASRLNGLCDVTVKEARTGDLIQPGHVLIAPGQQQMAIRTGQCGLEVVCEPGPNVCGHCPSVEVLFNSVARHAGSKAIGIMLTGMGQDGARGMLAMRQAGARTIAQDQASCVVFGMPKAAYECGAVECLVPLDRIADVALSHVSGTPAPNAP